MKKKYEWYWKHLLYKDFFSHWIFFWYTQSKSSSVAVSIWQNICCFNNSICSTLVISLMITLFLDIMFTKIMKTNFGLMVTPDTKKCCLSFFNQYTSVSLVELTFVSLLSDTKTWVKQFWACWSFRQSVLL